MFVSSRSAASGVHSSSSPGWQPSSRQRASSVEKRMARALLVLSTERFAMVMPMRSARSVRESRRSSNRWSSLTRIAMIASNRQRLLFIQAGSRPEDFGDDEDDQAVD